MTKEGKLSRRQFIKLSGIAAGAAVVGGALGDPKTASAEAAKAAAANVPVEPSAAVTGEQETAEKATKVERLGNKEYIVPRDFTKGELLTGNDGKLYLFGITGDQEKKLLYWNLGDGNQPEIGTGTEITGTNEYAAAVNPQADNDRNPSGIELMVSRKKFGTTLENIYWLESPDSEIEVRVGYAGNKPTGINYAITEIETATNEKEVVRLYSAMKEVENGDLQAFYGLQQQKAIEGVVKAVSEYLENRELREGKSEEIQIGSQKDDLLITKQDGKLTIEQMNSDTQIFFSEEALPLTPCEGVQMICEGREVFFLVKAKEYGIRPNLMTAWFGTADLSQFNERNKLSINNVWSSMAIPGLEEDVFDAKMFVNRLTNDVPDSEKSHYVKATIVYRLGGKLYATTVAYRVKDEEGGALETERKAISPELEEAKRNEVNRYDFSTGQAAAVEIIWPPLPDLFDVVLGIFPDVENYFGGEDSEKLCRVAVQTEEGTKQYVYRLHFISGLPGVKGEFKELYAGGIPTGIETVHGRMNLVYEGDGICGLQNMQITTTNAPLVMG